MNKDSFFALQLVKDKCIGCGACAESCPYDAIRMDDYPEINEDNCRLCGGCVQACPAEALVMERPRAAEATASEDGGIWVWAEVEDGALAPVSLELLGKATELSAATGQPVEAVLMGDGVDGLTAELIACGADKVRLMESPRLANFIEENYMNALAAMVSECRPSILLIGATTRGRGLSARLAATVRTGLTADCTELEIDPRTGLLRQIRPAFGGNLMATIVNPDHRPQMASVRPCVMKSLLRDERREGEVIRHEFKEDMRDERVRLIEAVKEEALGSSLNDSRVIVGIGRGVKTKKRADEIRDWARRIGAAVAGSRAAVEAGLVDASLQVGQTGHTIAPDLYVAIGISGQIQHTAAITGARKVLAINPDRTAPIFSVADYGWAVPVEEALPRLMEALPERG